MDLRESRIADAIRELTIEEGIGLGRALAECSHFKQAIRVKRYLLEQLKMHVERLEANEASEPATPGLAEMDIDALAQWLVAAALLNDGFRVAGGIERVVDAIVGCVAVQAAAAFAALHQCGVHA